MEQELKTISDFVIAQLKRTLDEQGHKLSGTLESSLMAHNIVTLNGALLNFYYEDYGVPLDTGVPANKIPFSPGSGAKSSKYIDGLMRYVKARMNVSGDKEAKSIAFAIAYKQKREGMSTEASKRFSTTGKRNNWVNNTLERIDDELTELINRTLSAILDDMIFNAIKNYGSSSI